MVVVPTSTAMAKWRRVVSPGSMSMTWRRPESRTRVAVTWPLRGAQRVGQLADAQEGELDRPLAPVMLDGAREAVQVGQPAFQLGRLDLQQPLDGQGIELPLPGQQFLPDQVGLVLGRELARLPARPAPGLRLSGLSPSMRVAQART